MITTDNYELYFFQYQEGMLDEAARREVEAFAAAHPDLAEELELYAAAPVLTAQEEETMPHKERLRQAVPFVWWRYVAAAALVVAVATALVLTLRQPEAEGWIELAENNVTAAVADSMDSAIVCQPIAEAGDPCNFMERTPLTPSAPSANPVVAQVEDAPIVEAISETLQQEVSEPIISNEEPMALLAESNPTPALESESDPAIVPQEAFSDTITYTLLLADTPMASAQYAKPSFANQAQSLWHIASLLYPEQTAPINNLKATVEETTEHVKPIVKKIEPIYQFIAKIF